MTRDEALDALEAGKRVRRIGSNSWWEMRDGKVFCVTRAYLTPSFANQWEIVPEDNSNQKQELPL